MEGRCRDFRYMFRKLDGLGRNKVTIALLDSSLNSTPAALKNLLVTQFGLPSIRHEGRPIESVLPCPKGSIFLVAWSYSLDESMSSRGLRKLKITRLIASITTDGVSFCR